MRPSRGHQYKLYKNRSVSRVRAAFLVNVLSTDRIHCLIALISVHFQNLDAISCVLTFRNSSDVSGIILSLLL